MLLFKLHNLGIVCGSPLVSLTSNKYSSFKLGLEVSKTAILLVPLLIYLPIFLFQISMLATIVASGL
ncbi:hypothetical protein ACFOSP_02125 [Clostridium punense]|uniref:hypothetical protein n=1 Tax=Clostridium punense TaxID=1054297 RepID=UPI00360D2802